MKLKKVTLFALIGAIISLFFNLLIFLEKTEVIDISYTLRIYHCYFFANIVSSCTLALFFYTLYKNQK